MYKLLGKITVKLAWNIIIGLMLCDQVIAKAFATEAPGRPATKVTVDTVRIEPYRQTAEIIGRFVPRQSGIVSALSSGAVQILSVETGDRVEAGDIISTLNKDRLKWQLELKQSEVAQYRAQFKTKKQKILLLRQELQRLKSLKNSPAFSRARLDDKIQQIAVAESQAIEAKAELNKSKADQKLTEISLKNAEIRAPNAGIITQKHTSIGAYLKIGEPVVTLVDTKMMEIEADIPSLYINGLNTGTISRARTSQDSFFSVTVRAIIPVENPRTRTRAVRFTVGSRATRDNETYAANQSVILEIPAGIKKNALTVHKDAVMSRNGRKIVALAVEKKVQLQAVELGPTSGSRFIVKDGLKAGDLTIVRGNERLLPGVSVQFNTPSKGVNKNGGAKKADSP